MATAAPGGQNHSGSLTLLKATQAQP
jgi:hypothetical protein